MLRILKNFSFIVLVATLISSCKEEEVSVKENNQGVSYTRARVSTSAVAWETLPNLLIGVMRFAAIEINGKIYVFSGHDGDSQINAVQIYNPSSNSWTLGSPMPFALLSPSAVKVNGKVFITGIPENSTTPKIFEFDPVKNKWKTVTSVPTAREYYTTAALNGKIYVIGGLTGEGRQPGSTIVEEYNPSTNTWATKASLLTGRYYAKAVAINGKLIVAGGSPYADQYVQKLSSVEEYNPNTNSWKYKASIPREGLGIGLTELKGLVFAIGGYDTEYLVDAYNPITDVWESYQNLNYGRSFLETVAVANSIYAIGGYSYDGRNKVERLTLKANTSLFTNVSTTSGKKYAISKIKTGNTYHTDRYYTFTEVPSFLSGAEFIKTANDDKTNTSTDLLTFTLTKKSNVYVLYDPRAVSLPAWMKGWKKLPYTVKTTDSEANYFDVYTKTLKAGTITLGGALASPASETQTNYIVAGIPTDADTKSEAETATLAQL